jgi:hypothetical protein
LDRDFCDPESGESGIDRQLKVELHSRTDGFDEVIGFPAKGPISTVHIRIPRLEEKIENGSEQRVADEAV